MPKSAHSGSPPIATATVARLYMEQGKLDQAERIYRALQTEDPEDPRLGKGIAEIERRRLGPASLNDTGDRVALTRSATGGLCCSWAVTTEGRQSAELVLGSKGQLVLRVVPFPILPDAVPEDVRLDRPEGDLTIDPPREASLVGAAVGLLDDGGGFVSITHCRPFSLKS